MTKRKRYPGLKEAEQQRSVRPSWYIPSGEQPDFIGGAPNYQKYKGAPPEQVLVWLNID